MDNELADLLQPITVNWKASDLEEFVEAYTLNNRKYSAIFFLTNGIQINHQLENGAIIGFDGRRLSRTRIQLTPHMNEAAREQPEAIEEMRLWRNAIEAEIARRGISFPSAWGEDKPFLAC